MAPRMRVAHEAPKARAQNKTEKHAHETKRVAQAALKTYAPKNNTSVQPIEHHVQAQTGQNQRP